MSNNQLPADVQERIKADAREYCKDQALGSREDCSYCIPDYIAGATAVYERAQKERETWGFLHKGYNKALEDREAKAKKLAEAVDQYFNAPKGEYMYHRMKLQNALQQWKGEGEKEVGDE